MKILMIAINDPAGTAILFTKAINRYTEHTCRLITKETRYNHLFEKDLHLPWLEDTGWSEVEHLLKKSDIFHFHMTADENIELGPFKIVDFIHGKQIVHHHHGHPDFRGNPHKYKEKYKALKRQNLIVSTPDLLKLLPEAKWVPNLVPLNELLYTPHDVPVNGKVLIGQSPTRLDLKNTSDISDVVNKLRQHMPEKRVELDIITDTQHKECLARKRNCHIIFDHMQGYYGIASLESLSQGKPVIAGLDDWNMRKIQEFTGINRLPWIIARNEEQLRNQLLALIENVDSRTEHGRYSREFMEYSWSEQRVLKVLFNSYG